MKLILADLAIPTQAEHVIDINRLAVGVDSRQPQLSSSIGHRDSTALHGARSPLRRSKPAVQAGRPRRRRRLDDPADDGQSKHVAPVEVEPQQDRPTPDEKSKRA